MITRWRHIVAVAPENMELGSGQQHQEPAGHGHQSTQVTAWNQVTTLYELAIMPYHFTYILKKVC